MAARKKSVRGKSTRKRARRKKPSASAPRERRAQPRLASTTKRRARPRSSDGARRSAAGAARKPRSLAAAAKKRASRKAKPARIDAAGASAPAPLHAPATSSAAPPRAHAETLAILASAPIRIGVVRHFYPRSRAALIALEAPLAANERIHVHGVTSDFVMQVRELRVGGAALERVACGDATLEVPQRVRPGDAIFALRSSG